MKCIFLDRDGVLNKDRVNYAYRLEDFHIIEGVPEALALLKAAGWLIVVITNQSGIGKGIYGREDMERCHRHLQEVCNDAIDAFYHAPYHPSITESLTRKPDSLMFEKAIAKYGIDAKASWMLGDKERDLAPAQKLGIATILVDAPAATPSANYTAATLLEAVRQIILKTAMQ